MAYTWCVFVVSFMWTGGSSCGIGAWCGVVVGINAFQFDYIIGVLPGLMWRYNLDGGVSCVMMLLHCSLCCVNWMFTRFACICPLVLVIKFSGQRRTCFVVMTGNVVRYPAWIAFASVARVGKKRDQL